jgi:SAM-dependent methyltransferase
MCPRCRAAERHRSLVLFLREYTNLYTARLQVLHLAPEEGLRRELSSISALDYLTADLIRDDVDVRVDVSAMEFPDESFDVIICSHVLEHVPDDRAAMRELRRVLRRTGWAVIDAPVFPELDGTFEDWSAATSAQRLRLFGQEDHVRKYGRDYPDLLRAEGWQVVVDPRPFTSDETRRYVLDPGNHIYYCTRA